jgi:chromosome segregation ATPase
MSKKYFILSVLSIAILTSSCVSKKKFLEMQDGRLKAEEQVRQLTEESNARAQRIEALIADFEAMKNELMQSNAIKDQYIDSLNSEVFVLNEKLNKQTESLQETSFNLDFEKQRLTAAIENKDKSIRTLESRISQMEDELNAKTQMAEQYSFDKRQLAEKIDLLESQKKGGENKVTELQSQLEKIKSETAVLKAQIKEKDEAITRLENNVKLLKKELGR